MLQTIFRLLYRLRPMNQVPPPVFACSASRRFFLCNKLLVDDEYGWCLCISDLLYQSEHLASQIKRKSRGESPREYVGAVALCKDLDRLTTILMQPQNQRVAGTGNGHTGPPKIFTTVRCRLNSSFPAVQIQNSNSLRPDGNDKPLHH
jgi:hypothetical protein